VLPVSFPDIRAPTDSTPMEAPAVTSVPPDLPQYEKILSTGPTPLDEAPSVPIARRPIATPEEVLHAHTREFDHALHEALDRLTEAYHMISLMKAEVNRFRDIEFLPLVARFAAMESLNIVPSSGLPAFKATQEGYPKKEVVSHSNRSRSNIRGDAERAALVSGLQITTRKTSTRKPARAPMTGPHGLMTQAHGRAIVSRASPSLGWRKLSLPDRTASIWFHTVPIGWQTAVTGKMSTYLKRVKHAISPYERLNGDVPIEILAFLRTFKEAADHKELSEATAARLTPCILTGAAKEGYRAHLDEARRFSLSIHT
jgi:hypothetical protein